MRQLGLLVTGVLLMVAGSAFAQDTSRGEFSGGWRHYHATISSVVNPIQLDLPNDYPKGWYADVAVNLSPKFAIVGEVGGSYHSDEISQTTGPVSITTRAATRARSRSLRTPRRASGKAAPAMQCSPSTVASL